MTFGIRNASRGNTIHPQARILAALGFDGCHWGKIKIPVFKVVLISMGEVFGTRNVASCCEFTSRTIRLTHTFELRRSFERDRAMPRRRTLIGACGAGVLLVVTGALVALRPEQRPAATPLVGTSSEVPKSVVASPVGRFAISGTVTSVVDGDTVDVVGADGGRVRVRVLGIDTPETKDPRKALQCWGPEASAYAEQTLLERRVSLYTDPTQSVRDKYGRLLAYVILSDAGTNYSVAAAAAGAARSYVYGAVPVTAAGPIAAAEQRARDARLGLWGPPCNGAAVASSVSPSPYLPPSPDAPSATGDNLYLDSCAQARAAGRAPLYRAEPGYRPGLDGDGDGTACE
jgi:micrococcal nuclease